MKKLLCVALFGIAITASAAEKTELVPNNAEDVKVEKTISKTVESNVPAEEILGCGAQGNGRYSVWRQQGYSHREARSLRRGFVRKCRGYFWQVLSDEVEFELESTEILN